MARSRVKIDMLGGRGIREVMASDNAKALVGNMADDVAAACNSDSSWGGYYAGDASSSVRARATVWSIGGNGEERKNRLLRNLDAGA
jgi:hypothetical protein